MNYAELAKTYQKLESTPKMLEKRDILSDFIKQIPDDEVGVITLLLRGLVFPEWDQKELGIADKLAIKAIASTAGESIEKVTCLWKEIGDLGEVAEKLVGHKKQSTLFQKNLTVKKVHETLAKLPDVSGSGAVDKKISLIKELLSSSDGLAAKYIIRTVLGTLRVGVGDGTIRDAIAKAFNKDEQEVEDAYNITTDFGKVVEMLKSGKKLASLGVVVGRPLRAMLAQKEPDIKTAFERSGAPAQLELKFDGFRMQLHKKGDKVKIFTRRLEDVTKQFQLIADDAKKALRAEDIIVEGEAVGYDPETGKLLPFQAVSQRIKRKYDLEKLAKEVPVRLYLFDVLYKDGKILIDEPFKIRRIVLEKAVKETKHTVLSPKLITKDVKEAETFFKDSLAEGQEGIMVKSLDAKYVPGSRVGNWVKIKPEAETLDLTIVGAEWGTGKRASWLSSFTLACRRESEFVAIGKMGTGVKEKSEEGVSFEDFTKMLKVISGEGKEVVVKPTIVIEVGYEEIQKSPTYASGYALRFPRFLRIRLDKPLEEVDDISKVEKLYKEQRGRN